MPIEHISKNGWKHNLVQGTSPATRDSACLVVGIPISVSVFIQPNYSFLTLEMSDCSALRWPRASAERYYSMRNDIRSSRLAEQG
ncbi:hypothetical protein Mapa_003024 [Marchantia paleacea]|nr:hypothetical protein Mapa_003024 [Marchantia paleacea]